MFLWNLLIAFLLMLFPIAVYAFRKNRSCFEWKCIFTDNLARIIAAILIIVIGVFVMTYVPELNELLNQSGLLVGSASAGVFGFGVGGLLVSFLPSDSKLKRSYKL